MFPMVLFALFCGSELGAGRRINTNDFIDPNRRLIHYDKSAKITAAVKTNANTRNKVDQQLKWKGTFTNLTFNFNDDALLTTTFTILQFIDKYSEQHNFSLNVRPYRS